MARNVLITGASSGIGFETAMLLRNNGFNVYATVRNAKDAEHMLKNEINPLICDLSNMEDCKSMVNLFISMTNGNVYGLFNNAAYGQPGAMEDITEDLLASQYQVNVIAQHYITSRLTPYMRQAKKGRVVFDSSVLGIVHMPMRGAYTSSKFALEGLAATWRLELHPYNIQVSVIRPGPIATNFKNRAYKALQNVDFRASDYLSSYEALIARLTGSKPSKATKPSKVAKKVLHAFSSKHPKNYYRVTINTFLTEVAIRLLPSKWLDAMVRNSY